jgi:hypothetical protein
MCSSGCSSHTTNCDLSYDTRAMFVCDCVRHRSRSVYVETQYTFLLSAGSVLRLAACSAAALCSELEIRAVPLPLALAEASRWRGLNRAAVSREIPGRWVPVYWDAGIFLKQCMLAADPQQYLMSERCSRGRTYRSEPCLTLLSALCVYQIVTDCCRWR